MHAAQRPRNSSVMARTVYFERLAQAASASTARGSLNSETVPQSSQMANTAALWCSVDWPQATKALRDFDPVGRTRGDEPIE